MNKKVIYILSSIFGLVALLLAVLLINKNFISKDIGNITVSLIDENGIVLDIKEISYKENDKLVDLLDENFENFSLGDDGFLDSIGTLEGYSTSTSLFYISIVVDGEYSNYGLRQLEFRNGMEISFVLEEYKYE